PCPDGRVAIIVAADNGHGGDSVVGVRDLRDDRASCSARRGGAPRPARALSLRGARPAATAGASEDPCRWPVGAGKPRVVGSWPFRPLIVLLRLRRRAKIIAL